MNPLALLIKHRRLLFATTIHEVRTRYIGTTFGLLWAFLYPVLFLGLYAVVYTMIFRVRLGGYTTIDYVLLIFSGLIPFLGFSEALGSGVGAVTGNKGLVKNTLFPIELIPVRTALACSVTMLVGLSILLAVLWMRGIIHATQALVPIILVLQLIFTIGVLWLLSSLNVFFPDIGHLTSVLILFLMLVSPIAYTHDMIPSNLMPLMYPNPLYYLIMLYRDAIVIGTVKPMLLTVFAFMAVASFASGYFVFSRLKTIFVDYV